MTNDPVTAPLHYAGDGKVTAKEAMRSMMHGADVTPIQAYWWGCAFKYAFRWPHKGNPIQDIDKAIQCLTELRKEVSDGDPR